MKLTVKQLELLRVITAGPCDLDEIVERVQYDTTKASLQFSIRALVGHGMVIKSGIEKRRGRQRAVIEATALAHAVMAAPPRSSNPVVSTELDGELPPAFEVDLE